MGKLANREEQGSGYGKSMNKSSSFYGEEYYQKARKLDNVKKEVYRERNKQLYDQEHELDILKFYVNRTGCCEMIRYYELIADQFFVMKAKNIKGSDEYNQTVAEYMTKVNDKIKQFHDVYMCDEYETLQQRRERVKKEQQAHSEAKDEGTNAKPIKPINEIDLGQTRIENSGNPRKLGTCNQCPIFIEEYEYNFQKTTTTIAKQSSYWDKLNGNQKLSKFRRYIQHNLKILKYELQNKCEFARRSKQKPFQHQKYGLDFGYL